MPLDAYRERVRQATTALDSLTLVDETEGDQAYAARRASTVRGVRSLLPPEDNVEWKGGSVRVDNRWLAEALERYERLPANDPRRRGELSRITERLRALADRLEELGGPKESAGKEDAKAKLAAILRREEYSRKEKEESAIARLLKRLLRWLEDLFPKTSPMSPGRASLFARIAQVVVYGLSLGVIVFVLWKFGPRLVERFRVRAKKKEKPGARVVLGEHLAPDQSATDLLIEAETLARKGDLRAAIRKCYIALLCELGDRKVVRLAQHMTNRDYLRAVEERPALHGLMRPLTESFESHWYGYVPATPEDWASFRAKYQKAVTSA
ncbi:MAG TPA: DUF4129 domain-containing protein [Pyrinomonadaceae bacterium]